MAIAVHCRCGKKFKVKDRLAGKAVRCPACKGPLRIGKNRVGGVGPTPCDKRSDGETVSKREEEEAILRVEKAREQKQASAETEAVQREERNKLIASYDQQAGRTEKAKKKGLPDIIPRKPTFFSKIADLCGIVCGTLAFKYVVIVVLLAGGVVGSVYLVQTVTSYVQDEGGPPKPKQERIEELFKKAEAAIEARRWGEARDALDTILRLESRLEVNRRYRDLEKRLKDGFEEG